MARTFFAYFLSFAIVGFWWTIHMRVTRSLHRFDWPTASANMLFILTVTLIPFAASVLGENIANAAAWTVYWGVNAMASVALTVMMVVSTRNGGRLVGGMTRRQRTGRLIQSIGPGLGFMLGAYLAYIGYLDLSRWCWVAIPPMMTVARLVGGRAVACAPSPEIQPL